ncbi:TerC family protein [Sulfuriroseicoccus oceanibius]|uniref:TerC family protein n=1 Tax=Sulfuriroseicoccus oceanibius TaxID=2707525 RepID=A0A6B3L4M1_9BACT|nr:TerC family protein [Sulfuriroseicoccus oceanibius]QQL45133.1 TerC family protein [Sulfuriroseicoccus oceanibius]
MTSDLSFLLADAAAAAGPDSLGNLIGVLLLLLGLELVLGVDNILVISIMVARLPEAQQQRARIIGLALALVARIVLLFGVTWLLQLNTPLGEEYPALAGVPIIASLSVKNLILLAGGLFLLYKAVHEIHHVVELHEETAGPAKVYASFGAVITQIVMLDIVFSLDSVITAVGLTSHLMVIIVAVVAAFAVVLAFAKPIGDFILAHPALKILALSFLVTIGVTIIMEAFNQHVPKGYIYLPMGFALVVELLQMRYSSNRKSFDTRPPAES